MGSIPIFDEAYLRRKVNEYLVQYCAFMNIEEFPNFNIEFYTINHELVDSNGFGASAQAQYLPKEDRHILKLCRNFEVHKYILFHEFTHILDAEVYAKKDSAKYMYESGYTEYHASQVEFMCLLEAKSISDKNISFCSENTIFTLTGNQKIGDYVEGKHELAVALMSREDYPKDIEMLKTAVGALYNYWGLRSICKMYNQSYKENVDNTAIKKVIDPYLFEVTNAFMDGFFDKSKVELSFRPYSNIVIPVATKLCGK